MRIGFSCFISLTMVLLCTTNARAQKVSVKKDTIYVDTVKYAVLKKKGLLEKVFTVQNLQGEDLVVIKQERDDDESRFLNVIFLGSGRKIMMESSNNDAKHISEAIVESGLIVEGKVSEAGERKFCLIHEKSKNETHVTTTSSQEMVVRDRNADISVSGEKIMQDGKLIGKISSETDYAAQGMPVRYNISLPGGAVVASGKKANEWSSGEVVLITAKDNRTHTIKIRQNWATEDEIAKFLVENLYL